MRHSHHAQHGYDVVMMKTTIEGAEIYCYERVLKCSIKIKYTAECCTVLGKHMQR